MSRSRARASNDDEEEALSQPQRISEEAQLWDARVRRGIRIEQRKIIHEVHKNRDDITLPTELIKHVNSLDSLYKDVVASKEAAIDSEGFRLLSAIGREQVEATQGSLIQFDTTSYAEKLVTYMGGRRGTSGGELGHLNWAKLGDRAVTVFRKPPVVNFLFGALELEPLKKRQANARRKKLGKEVGEESRPKEVQNLQDEEESTTKDVQHIMNHVVKACRVKGRVGYFHFLVDPTSFGHTVENMFHFSFLIKDGRVGVIMGREGIPYIYLPSDTVNGQSSKTTKNQVVVSLTIEDWKKAIQKFNITSASIPRRE